MSFILIMLGKKKNRTISVAIILLLKAYCQSVTVMEYPLPLGYFSHFMSWNLPLSLRYRIESRNKINAPIKLSSPHSDGYLIQHY